MASGGDGPSAGWADRYWGSRPLAELLARWVPLTFFLLDQADAARRLANDLALA